MVADTAPPAAPPQMPATVQPAANATKMTAAGLSPPALVTQELGIPGITQEPEENARVSGNGLINAASGAFGTPVAGSVDTGTVAAAAASAARPARERAATPERRACSLSFGSPADGEGADGAQTNGGAFQGFDGWRIPTRCAAAPRLSA